MEAINAMGAGAARMKSLEMGLPPEAQLAILLLSIACAAWMLSLVLPLGWRELATLLRRRFAGKRRSLSGVAGR